MSGPRNLLALALLAGVALGAQKDVTQLQIGVKHRPDGCKAGTVQKAKNGDKLKIHYTGMLTNGEVFDSSVERGDPFSFSLGQGQVIKGWEQGILGMCIGEKRRLKIPPHLGYGDNGSPPKIPGGATLIFETELMEILDPEPEPDFGGMDDMGDYGGGMGGMGDMAEMMGGMGGGGYGDDYADY